MKPYELKLPLGRASYSIPKLVLLLAVILLVINIFPLSSYPFLPPYRSSTLFPSSLSSSSILVSSYLSSSTIISTSSSVNITSTSSSIVSTISFVSPSPPPRPPPIIQTSISSSSSSFSSSHHSPVASTYNSPPPLPPSPLPPPPTQPPPPPPIATKPNSKSGVSVQECDISKGEWVHDSEAPYYTNTTCSMIQEHQNCMKFGRPDMDFLKWRWRPQGCELPRFDPALFLELVRGKSMAFIGDSLARNHMQSLMCLLSRVESPKDLVDTATFKSMFYTNYNFTISIFWSPFLVKAEEVHQNTSYGDAIFWNLYLDEADKKWASRLNQFDYVIVSGGNWFNRPSYLYRKHRRVGCLYCDNNTNQKTMQYSNRMAFRTALRAINRKANFKGTLILRALSPSHFENGEWNKGGNCARTGPYRRNEVRMEEKERGLYKAQLEEFRRAEKEGRKRGLEFRLLDTAGAMLLRPDGHPSRYGHRPDEKVVLYNDCVHWCLPGPVDTWNDFLLHTLNK